MYAVNHHYHDHHDHQEEIPQKLPYLEVWLNKFSTIHAGIKGQQTIGSHHGIMKACKLDI